MNKEKKFELSHLEDHALTEKELAQKNWKTKKAKKTPISPTKREIHAHNNKTRVWPITNENKNHKGPKV